MSVLLLLLACAGGPEAEADSEPAGWGAERETQARKYLVSVDLEPDPPVMGELFAASATVRTRDGEVVEDATVVLDALMPQHGHGMMTSPKGRPGVCDEAGACTHPGGVYTADGFKFHMGGAWTVTVDIDGPRGRDNTSFVYELR